MRTSRELQIYVNIRLKCIHSLLVIKDGERIFFGGRLKTRSQLFIEQHRIMVDWINLYLDALTDDELQMEIMPGRNHGVWILGHLFASEEDLSLFINGEPVLYPDC